MDIHVFARVREFFVLLGEGAATLPDAGSGNVFSADELGVLLDADVIAADVLTDAVRARSALPAGPLVVMREVDHVILVPQANIKPMFRRRQLESVRTRARERTLAFHLAIRERLIKALYGEATTLAAYVGAWSEYLFADHFSLWIYNRYTEAFTCSTSSFAYPRDFLFRDDDSSLNRVLEEDYIGEARAVSQGRVTVDATREIRSLNRIRLNLGLDGTVGVLTFYSRHREFPLAAPDLAEIRNSIETKYMQVRQQAHQATFRINQQFIETYRAGQLDEFLFGIACEVRAGFVVEACSIFLPDATGTSLVLAATCDNRLHGQPDRAYAYPLKGPAPTAGIHNTGVMAFSYDLGADDPNNEGYNESTDHAPKNWIGMPLMAAGQCFGVLRVRNKWADNQGERSIVNFRLGDFASLHSLCSNLANLIRIETLFNETETRLAQTRANMEEMNDFNKVFLHEIRTPISKFTMAPEIIKRTLKNKELTATNLEKVVRQLDDIQVMGDRLEFIAKTFNFNQIVTRRNFEMLSVLRDIVFPVINITRAYLRKQYDIDIQMNATGLQSSRVYGDKTLLNIVFNTLIDNAGKYSIDTRRPIRVDGGSVHAGAGFDIVVSNYGLPIHPDEAEGVFKKGVRGREALRHGIGGTGIGLHLAERIMTEGGGELLLTSLSDPVSFTMRIPARMPVSEES